jgi:hypothetical protein
MTTHCVATGRLFTSGRPSNTALLPGVTADFVPDHMIRTDYIIVNFLLQHPRQLVVRDESTINSDAKVRGGLLRQTY